MIRLNDCGVRFDAGLHTYTAPNGRTLRGITGLLHDKLFPDTYKGVDEETLRKAAERGTAIHRMCEDWDEIGTFMDDDTLRAYIGGCNDHGLVHHCSEYLVSDMDMYASSIDKVFRVDDETVDIADIKTTYRLDKEYVSWQLSVYAYLLELQNPHARVRKLLAIHLRDGKCKVVEVERKSNEDVKKLLYSDEVPDLNPYAMPMKYRVEEGDIIRYAHLAKYYSDKVAELKERMLADMESAHATRWETERVQVVRREGSRTEKFDAKRFKEEHADMYAEYVTESVTKSSITIKIKGE